MFGIYIHIPFCLKKCSYCDFNSYSGQEALFDDYIESLLLELKHYSAQTPKVTSLYFGGGTPTLLSLKNLDKIISCCFREFNLSSNAEISIEANPETINGKKLRGLKEIGFNRLSLGFQSLQPRLLKILGRIHSPRRAYQSYEEARAVGFKNINIDLIYGIPTETLDDWMETLDLAISLTPEHLSLYPLTLESFVLMAKLIKKGEIPPICEDEQAQKYQLARRFLKRKGYFQYEISNFSKRGKECHHNLIYWKNYEYLGLGAGAHSHFKGIRYSNHPHPKKYLKSLWEKNLAIKKARKISFQESISETLVLGLRLCEGIREKEFRQRFGISFFNKYAEKIEGLQAKGLLKKGRKLELTSKGLFLANEVFVEFI